MWWENMYNTCAAKISTNNNDHIEKHNFTENKKLKNNKEDKNLKYSIFVKKNNCIISAFCDNYSQNSSKEKEDNHNSHTKNDTKNGNNNEMKNGNDFKTKHKEINKEKNKMNSHFGNNIFHYKNKMSNNNNFIMNKSKAKKNGKKCNNI